MATELQAFVREYDPQRDRPAVEAWSLSRGMAAVPEQILPKLGIVACWEPGGCARAAGWLYMDNSVGVARIEFLNTQPGMNLANARRALHAIIEFLTEAAKGFGYVVIQCLTYKALAREARALGYRIVQENLISIVKEVR